MRCVLFNEVEMKQHEIDGVNQIFKLLGITERQPCESAIEQAHGKILPLHEAGAD